MATFQIAHGLSMATNSWIENLHVESLSSDPASLNAEGRVWYNNSDKEMKMTVLDAGGSVVIRKVCQLDDLNAFQTELASTDADTSGADSVGFDGHSGTNGNFSVSSGVLDDTLDTIIQQIDDNIASLGSNDTDISNLQTELDDTQTGAGLDTDGVYSADTNANYINDATSLFNADVQLDTQVKANYDDIQTRVTRAGDAMTGNLSFNGSYKVTNLADPTADYDAAHKLYVDQSIQGLDVKSACRLATTAELSATYDSNNMTLTGDSTGALSVDGVTPDVGDRILVKNQSDATTNGIYVVNIVGDSGTAYVLERAVDFDGDPAGEVQPGSFSFVYAGNANNDNGYVVTTDTSSFTFDTDPIYWEQFSGAGQTIAGTGLSKNGNELNVNLGSGIQQEPSDEVGVHLYSTGGLWTTTDGSSESTGTDAMLAIKTDDGDTTFGKTLSLSSNGIRLDTGVVTKINSIQTELDDTQTGAGLGTSGSYSADGTTNYISSATSLFNADVLLDSQMKTNADSISSLQTELDATQTGAGLGTDGSYTAPGSSNYLGSAGSLFNADVKLDTQIKTNETNISNLQSELDTTQTGAGLDSDGNYTALSGSNFISGATSLKNADSLLDSQVKNNKDAVDNLMTSINNKVFKVDRASAQTHSITHNLGTQDISVQVLVKDPNDSKLKNDLCGIIVDTDNAITVELTESREIKVIVQAMTDVSDA